MMVKNIISYPALVIYFHFWIICKIELSINICKAYSFPNLNQGLPNVHGLTNSGRVEPGLGSSFLCFLIPILIFKIVQIEITCPFFRGIGSFCQWMNINSDHFNKVIYAIYFALSRSREALENCFEMNSYWRIQMDQILIRNINRLFIVFDWTPVRWTNIIA